jgi:DNA-nicking Smr family endonuclease
MSQKPKPYPREKTLQFADKLTLAQTEAVHALHAEDTISYTASGLQKNVLKKMRRGHYGLDAELDLHGLTSAEALSTRLHPDRRICQIDAIKQTQHQHRHLFVRWNKMLALPDVSYTASGLQKNVLKKMRRGHYGLDAELDLHGLTSAEAKRELVKFLHF